MAPRLATFRVLPCAYSLIISAMIGLLAASAVAANVVQGNDQPANSGVAHTVVAMAAAVALVAVLVVALVGGACCSRRPVPMEAQIQQPMTVAKRRPFVYVKVRVGHHVSAV